MRRDLDVEVNGKRFAVSAWVPDVAPVVGVAAGAAPAAAKPRRAASGDAAGGGAGSGAVAVPMQGTIVKVLVEVGQAVEAGSRS